MEISSSMTPWIHNDWPEVVWIPQHLGWWYNSVALFLVAIITCDSWILWSLCSFLPDCTLPASTLLLDFVVNMGLNNTLLLYFQTSSLHIWECNFWRKFNMIGQVGELNGISDLIEVLRQVMITKLGWNHNKNKDFPASEKRELAVYLKVLPRRKPRIESHNYLLYVFVFLLVWVWNNESNYKSCLIRMLIVFNAFKVSYKSVLYWLHPICLSFPSLNIILL